MTETEYKSLADAMDAGDALAEARMRYRLLAETFEAEPKLRSQLSPAIERAKDEVLRLSAQQEAAAPAAGDGGTSGGVVGSVVAFDATRFAKTG